MLDLINKLRQINWSHGVGEIKSIIVDVDKSKLRVDKRMLCGTVVRRFPYMKDDVRKWSCDGCVITFLGHKTANTH